MTTQFIQTKTMERFNKQVEAINAIAEGTRIFQTWTLEDIENGQYIGSSDIEFNKQMLKTVRQERIVRHAPSDIVNRLEEAEESLTWENVVSECEYVVQMIEDGGSYYDEEDTTELITKCKQIIKWSEKAKG